jgi:divalent metal cation (Fe/Co/Zn/Cd) transporter
VNCAEAFALGVGALVTGSVALTAQTATNVADVSVAVFLLIGVVSSGRPPDESHPLGYGREGFFWSLFAALGIFTGGGGVALEQAVDSALHPSPVHSYLAAYGVLAATCALEPLLSRSRHDQSESEPRVVASRCAPICREALTLQRQRSFSPEVAQLSGLS